MIEYVAKYLHSEDTGRSGSEGNWLRKRQLRSGHNLYISDISIGYEVWFCSINANVRQLKTANCQMQCTIKQIYGTGNTYFKSMLSYNITCKVFISQH